MSADDNVRLARDYLRALQAGETGEALARFFAAEVSYEEFPNRLFPQGRQANLEQMLRAAAQGQTILSWQKYDVVHAVSEGDQVALEVQWVGKLKVPVGSLPAGAEMRDRFATFLEFRDGRIVRQRNYDCFDPW